MVWFIRKYWRLRAEENTQGFPNRSFILRSLCVHRSPCTRICIPFAFCIRSPFTLHTSFKFVLHSHTIHSACVQRVFSIRSACAHHSSGKVKCFRDCSRRGRNKHIQIKYTMKIYGWTGNPTWDPCITSQGLHTELSKLTSIVHLA